MLSSQIGSEDATKMSKSVFTYSEVQLPLSVSPVSVDKLPPNLGMSIDPHSPDNKKKKHVNTAPSVLFLVFRPSLFLR